MELSSTVDGGDESEETDKAIPQEMDTQEPQAPSSPQHVQMDIKEEGEKTPPHLGTKSGERHQTGYDKN